MAWCQSSSRPPHRLLGSPQSACRVTLHQCDFGLDPAVSHLWPPVIAHHRRGLEPVGTGDVAIAEAHRVGGETEFGVEAVDRGASEPLGSQVELAGLLMALNLTIETRPRRQRQRGEGHPVADRGQCPESLSIPARGPPRHAEQPLHLAVRIGDSLPKRSLRGRCCRWWGGVENTMAKFGHLVERSRWRHEWPLKTDR